MQLPSLRAAARLAKFAGITSLHSAEAVGRSATKRAFEPAEAAVRIQRLGAALNESLGIDVRVQGRPPKEGVLLVANHRSYLDASAIAAQTPTLFLAKAEVARWPIVGSSAQAFATVFVQRESPESRQRSRVELRERLDCGVSVVVFPEGTTTRGPGLLPFRNGPFQIAVDAGVPVMPVSVFYPDRSLAYVDDDVFVPHFLSRFASRRIEAQVSFGPTLSGADAASLRDTCRWWIADQLAQAETTDWPLPIERAPQFAHVNARLDAALGEPG
jgi:1-acyl-sn-glycerol-3-phosphate acyltransferase